MGFSNPIDICNRGLMHCGSVRIDPTLGFTENSRQASATSFVYDKLRRAELRRNVWRFAIRKAALRPVAATTMFLAPTLWGASTTYYLGSVVSDQSGTLWISNSPDNLNNQPGQSTFWDLYCGPLAVQTFDSTTAYFAGELVYSAPGDGTYKVFLSLQNSNSDNPLVPQQWSVTAQYIKDQIVQFSPAWSSITTYSKGQTATYTDGNTYASLIAGNLNNIPPTSGAAWAMVPVNTPNQAPAILEWSSTTTYGLGNFADVNGTQYVSLVNANLNIAPAGNPASWAALTLWVLYASMTDANIGNEPDLAPAAWAVGTTYATGNKVCASDGFIYTSVGNGNVGNNPVSDGGVHWTNTGALCAWTTAGLSGSGSLKWLQLPAPVLVEQNFVYPIGAGPQEQANTRNVYRLPANYLRMAPQDPKIGSASILGAPSGRQYDDWDLAGNFLISTDTSLDMTPIVFRFVADIVNVSDMDDLFCEGLGCRIGLEVCEELTESTTKKQAVASEYNKFMTEARLVNGIETGPTEPPIDDYLACRL